MAKQETVALLGASNKPDRYAYKALVALKEAGHRVIPVNPALEEIEGVKVVKRITDIAERVDTVTLYVGSARVEEMAEEILALKPRRIISNPGTESEVMRQKAEAASIEFVRGCTLVMLRTGQF